MVTAIAILVIVAFIALAIWTGGGDDSTSNGPGLNQHNGGGGA